EVHSDRHTPAGTGDESRARRGRVRGRAGGAGWDSGRRAAADGVAPTGARVACGMDGTAGSGGGGVGGVLPGTARGAAPGRAFLMGRRGFRALGAGAYAGAARGRM